MLLSSPGRAPSTGTVPERRGVSHRARAPPGCCEEYPLPPAPGPAGPSGYLVGGAPGAAAAPSAGSILGSGVRLGRGRRAAAAAVAAASSAFRALLLGLPPPSPSTASARPSRAPLHGPGARARGGSAGGERSPGQSTGPGFRGRRARGRDPQRRSPGAGEEQQPQAPESRRAPARPP